MAGNPQLPLGGVVKHGRFARAGEVDRWRVDLPSKGTGYAILFKPSLVSNDDFATVRLLDADGRLLVDDHCNGKGAECLVELQAPYAGTYTLTVKQPRPPGPYTLKAAKDCPYELQTQCTLQVGIPAQGNIFGQGDNDMWAVSLIAGRSYDIVATVANPVSFTILSIILPTIGIVLRDGERSCVADKCVQRIDGFRPLQSGTFLVRFAGFYGVNGNYTLTVAPRL